MRFFTARSTVVIVLSFQLIFLPIAARGEGADTSNSYTVSKEEPNYKSGSVFVTSNKKDEVLLKANVWGAVQFPGVHYMPMGTHFLDAISFAGGPLDSANTELITLTSKQTENSGTLIREISVADALRSSAYNPVIQPDDIILIKEDHYREKATLILAICTVIITAASLGVIIAFHGN